MPWADSNSVTNTTSAQGAGEIPCSASSLLRGLDLKKGATVLGPVKDKARRGRAGLRPSLTSPARGGLPVGRSGRRDDRLAIEQRDDDCFGSRRSLTSSQLFRLLTWRDRDRTVCQS